MRLIDANALIEAYLEEQKKPGFYSIARIIMDAPTIDAVPVVHGRWEKHGKHDWRCTVCKRGVPYSFTGFNYCPNCGAKMDGE